ncbi:MAG: hypothetical protein FJ317_03245, partial [SAR202 cluster bacterium]|nr:hypothetical protein [SAR202 cluster bacterium]
GRFYILAESNTVKVKNIQRDPRICITVASHRSPYAYVMARGAAGLSKDRTRELLVGMSVRYMGDKKGRAYARTVENLDFLTIALEPSHTVAWSG